MADEHQEHDHYLKYDNRLLPDVWRIGPVYYTLSVEQDQDDLGTTDGDAHTVVFSTYLKGEQAKMTALHEALHALMYTYMPGYTRLDRGLSWKRADIAEAIPYHLGPALLGFMRDNPAWVLYIMEGVFYGFEVPTERQDSEDEEGTTDGPRDSSIDSGYL